MKLEVHERLILGELLPKEGDFAGMKAIRRAREAINFSPEEREFFMLRMEEGKVAWDTQRACEKIKDVPLEQFIMDLIRDALAILNKKKQLREEHMSLYDKFVVTYK